MRDFDVLSGCPWPQCRHSYPTSNGISDPLPRFLSLPSSLLNPGFSFCPAFLSHILASGLLSGPGCWIISLLVPVPQNSLSYKHEMLIWGKLDYRKLNGCSLYTADIHELQILTRVILLCFNHARVNYIFNSCNGYGSFSDVGWNDHFAIALKGGRKPKSCMTHIWFRSFKTYSLLLISTIHSWSRKYGFFFLLMTAIKRGGGRGVISVLKFIFRGCDVANRYKILN